MEEMNELPGCSDHNCIINKPKGMGTNGGCRHMRELCRTEEGRTVLHKLRRLEHQLAEVTAERDKLDAAIRTHRRDVWGAGPIEHPHDATLYGWVQWVPGDVLIYDGPPTMSYLFGGQDG